MTPEERTEYIVEYAFNRTMEYLYDKATDIVYDQDDDDEDAIEDEYNHLWDAFIAQAYEYYGEQHPDD